MTHMISFTPAKIRRFKRAYTSALGLMLTEFTFEGHQYDIVYARYLLEYFERETKSL